MYGGVGTPPGRNVTSKTLLTPHPTANAATFPSRGRLNVGFSLRAQIAGGNCSALPEARAETAVEQSETDEVES